MWEAVDVTEKAEGDPVIPTTLRVIELTSSALSESMVNVMISPSLPNCVLEAALVDAEGIRRGSMELISIKFPEDMLFPPPKAGRVIVAVFPPVSVIDPPFRTKAFIEV